MHLKKLLTGGWLALGVAVAPVHAKDPDAVAKEAREAIAKYTQEVDDLRARYAAASPEERQKLRQQRPDIAPAQEKAKSFIEACPAHREVPEVAAFLLPSVEGWDRAPIYKALTDHHLDSEALAEAVVASAYELNGPGDKFIDTVLEKAASPQAKGAAAYVRATRLLRQREGAHEERLKYLRLAVQNLGDLEVRGRRVKERAEGMLFVEENLSIGMVAPDIEGEDTEGVKFKLSDYRGKVVVLDFWGDW
ncbi:MAG: redoxin domain-containing protein [Akkermansiaceae bacterium]|nr:redoxin domain-containing protein [Akkermansiaceae bacterium]NNM29499.1 redoxin domain-containing protein [Akkermansiaceae bacterium]